MQTKPARQYASVTPPREPKVRHVLGWPKALRPEGDEPVPMPPARLLIIDDGADGVFLLRFSSQAEFAGDTWHETVAHAKEQAAFEFGSAPAWAPVATSDPISDDLVRHLLTTESGNVAN
jgi:hypothetical protein